MQHDSNFFEGYLGEAPMVELDEESDVISKQYENPKFTYEEMALMFCLLKDVDLLKRNKEVIKPEMFLSEMHGVMYQAMIDSADRGAKFFAARDIAERMRDIRPEIGLDETENQIKFILTSNKDPEFYSHADRLWRRWVNREADRKLKSAIMAHPDESDDRFAEADQALEIRRKTSPFASRCKTAKETLGATWSILSEIWAGREVFPKVSTGYPEVDSLFDGGFDLGSFAVVGAATGHGKTAGAVNIAASMVRQGTKVVFISLEETYRDLSMRLMTSQTGVPRKHLISRSLITEREQKMVHRVMEEFNDDRLQLACGSKNANEIVDLIRMHHERDGVKVFFVDYMQRIRMDSENRTAEVARFSLALGELAREHELVIIGTSQLKREGRREMAKRKPTTYDLSESSYLENEAAYIITLFRQDLVPELQNSDDYDYTLDNTIEFICCKQRNGVMSSTHLNFDGPSVRITSRQAASSTVSQYEKQFYEQSENEEVNGKDDGIIPPYQPYGGNQGN